MEFEGDYGTGAFTRVDFGTLPIALAGIKGRFMLSINDVPEARALFNGFRIEEVTTHFSIAGGDGMEAAEILVRARA